jgi:hypothetical protein
MRRRRSTKRYPRMGRAACMVVALSVGGLAMVGAGQGCANPPLQRIPEGIPPLNDELELEGTVCTQPDNEPFPVKILFLVDVSGSMVVTDPQNVRSTAVTDVIEKYQGLSNVYFAVETFSSAIVDITQGMGPGGSSFTNTPPIAEIGTLLKQSDNLTDDQGVLGDAYGLLTQDMVVSGAAERARTRYIINLFTDGTPDPVCSADTVACGPGCTSGSQCPTGQCLNGECACLPHTHCNPTTVLNASGAMTESDSCEPDFLICTVPKMMWQSYFNPPLNPMLYPNLEAGSNYNTFGQIMASVTDIMNLQSLYHVGSIQLNTEFLFPIAALSNPLAVPFDLDRPAAEGLLTAMASAGNGTFTEFTDASQINFLNIDYAAIQVQHSLVQSFASVQTAQQIGNAYVLDTDMDGLTDAEENSLGTCATLGGPAAMNNQCVTPWDTDQDGYSDLIEVLYQTSGFDPLDPNKPATKCLTPGVDSDGDGLMDCEEAFLGTDPTSPDTDGDFVDDLLEIRNQMNPLDPTDAFGDINKDTILNRAEIQDGLSPTEQVSSNEREFSLVTSLTPAAVSADAAANGLSCYDFDVQHLRLLTTPQQPPPSTMMGPMGGMSPMVQVLEGMNYVYYDVYDAPTDLPTTFATVRRACVKVLYRNGTQKLPLSGVVNFADSDFVPLDTFNRAMNCKDLTKGLAVGDAGSGGGG